MIRTFQPYRTSESAEAFLRTAQFVEPAAAVEPSSDVRSHVVSSPAARVED